MSRSYKKNPVMKSKCSKKYYKRKAAKDVRKNNNIGNGSQYKKYGDSYNINDYVSRMFSRKKMKNALEHIELYQIFMK